MRGTRWVCVLGLVGGVAACGPGASGGSDAARTDAGLDAESAVGADVGTTPEGGAEAATSCPDMDGDGHGAAPCGDDCDDTDRRRFPGAREVCDGEGRDEDCDPCTVGEVLPGGTGGDADRDDDGFPSRGCFNRLTGEAMPVCTTGARPDGGPEPAARVVVNPTERETRGTDCDDSAVTRNPAAPEQCDALMVDENCNMTRNEGCDCATGTSRRCSGADGAPLPGVCAAGMQDCIDGVWGMCSIAPSDETCNERDDDCDGEVDEGLRVDCYRDGDSDGFALRGAPSERVCATPAGSGTCPPGYTARAPASDEASDCDDTNAVRSPSTPELCNNLDDDCDGAVDEGLRRLCYRDVDGDTYAASGTAGTQQCGVMTAGVLECPSGYTARAPTVGAIDCNDESVVQAPNIMEVKCNGRNDDCNSATTDDCDMPGATCANNCGCPSGTIECSRRCLPVPTGPCERGTGACHRTGSYVCDEASGTIVCNAVAGVARPEIPCNGIDEDCDGPGDDRTCPATQECIGTSCGCAAGRMNCSGTCRPSGACGPAPGLCAATGTYVCVRDDVRCDLTACSRVSSSSYCEPCSNAGIRVPGDLSCTVNGAACSSACTPRTSTTPFRTSNVSSPEYTHACGIDGGGSWHMRYMEEHNCELFRSPAYNLPAGRYRITLQGGYTNWATSEPEAFQPTIGFRVVPLGGGADIAFTLMSFSNSAGYSPVTFEFTMSPACSLVQFTARVVDAYRLLHLTDLRVARIGN